MALDPRVTLACQDAALDIADAGAAQPLAGAFEPPGRGIAGDQLAAVLHLGGKGERLAAGPGAEIDNPHMGVRVGQQCRQLRALVLHLDEPVLEGGGAGQWRAVLEAKAERRPRGRLGLDVLGGQRAAGSVTVGLQGVDAQVERGRGVEHGHLVFETAAVERREIGFEPVRQIVGDGARHVGVGQCPAGDGTRDAFLGR